jgi:hypothetical protein
MTTHAGTGLFCLVRFINLILREVFFRAGIYERRIDFLRFLSVGVLDRSIQTLSRGYTSVLEYLE